MAKEYKAKRAADLGNVTSATTFKQYSDSTKAALAYVPQGAHMFYIRAKGTATGGTTTNFTPKIQIGNSATAATNVDFFSGGAAAYNSASGPFVMEVLCTYDSVNKLLSGVGWGVNGSGGAAISAAAATQATTSSITAVTFDLNSAPLPIAVTGLFSASNASNACTLEDLSVEVYATWER